MKMRFVACSLLLLIADLSIGQHEDCEGCAKYPKRHHQSHKIQEDPWIDPSWNSNKQTGVCPASDGISCEPSNTERPNPYYFCSNPTGIGAEEQPYRPPSGGSFSGETPSDSYVPSYYMPALTPEELAFLRDKSCTPGGATVCPFYKYKEPKGADGQKSASEYVIDLAHVDQPYDDFTGITYRGLNLAWDTWNMTMKAAAKSVGAPVSDGLLVFGREAFHAWWLWFPEGQAVLSRRAKLPAQTAYNNKELIKAGAAVFANLDTQFQALVRNDSTRFMAIANSLAEFHHKLQKNRPLVMKHHHFRTFERSVLATIKFFLAQKLTTERKVAMEEILDFIYRFNSHFLNLFDIGCKSFVNYEDFVRDPLQR